MVEERDLRNANGRKVRVVAPFNGEVNNEFSVSREQITRVGWDQTAGFDLDVGVHGGAHTRALIPVNGGGLGRVHGEFKDDVRKVVNAVLLKDRDSHFIGFMGMEPGVALAISPAQRGGAERGGSVLVQLNVKHGLADATAVLHDVPGAVGDHDPPEEVIPLDRL